MIAERTSFFNKFMEKPGKIGSITPSSAFLTQKMLARLAWNHMGTIVELGAGTGVFTRFIADHKKADCQALIIEQDRDMRERLQSEYPELFFGSNAENLEYLLNKLNVAKVDCIVSGLPFAVFPETVREKIIRGVSQSLRSDGVFVLFQYSLQMRKLLKKHFSKVEIGFELFNMPPAFIYRCQK